MKNDLLIMKTLLVKNLMVIQRHQFITLVIQYTDNIYRHVNTVDFLVIVEYLSLRQIFELYSRIQTAFPGAKIIAQN